MNTLLWIIGGIIAVVLIWVVFVYNGFIRLINRAKEAWSDIDVQLKRRHDLIPNLVNTVKAYAEHERETFEKVTESRAQAINAEGVESKKQAENQLTEALKSLFAVSENYPDLKANENFLELQRELSDTENKIQAARRFYNTNVRDLNTSLDSFPKNIIGNMFNFKKREYFEIEDESEKEVVDVNF